MKDPWNDGKEDPMIWIYRHRDGKTYNRIAKQVDIASAHSRKPCLGDGCDIDYRCPRHARTVELVYRYMDRFYKEHR